MCLCKLTIQEFYMCMYLKDLYCHSEWFTFVTDSWQLHLKDCLAFLFTAMSVEFISTCSMSYHPMDHSPIYGVTSLSLLKNVRRFSQWKIILYTCSRKQGTSTCKVNGDFKIVVRVSKAIQWTPCICRAYKRPRKPTKGKILLFFEYVSS